VVVVHGDGTYTDQNINQTRLDQESQYPDCLRWGSDADPTFLQQLAVFPVCTRVSHRPARRSQQYVFLLEATDNYAPGLEGYDGRCIDVD
jgi:hypothetical protein